MLVYQRVNEQFIWWYSKIDINCYDSWRQDKASWRVTCCVHLIDESCMSCICILWSYDVYFRFATALENYIDFTRPHELNVVWYMKLPAVFLHFSFSRLGGTNMLPLLSHPTEKSINHWYWCLHLLMNLQWLATSFFLVNLHLSSCTCCIINTFHSSTGSKFNPRWLRTNQASGCTSGCCAKSYEWLWSQWRICSSKWLNLEMIWVCWPLMTCQVMGKKVLLEGVGSLWMIMVVWVLNARIQGG